MKMITSEAGTQSHLVGSRASRRGTLPQDRERVPTLVCTTMALGNELGRQVPDQPAANDSTATVVNTEGPKLVAAKSNRPARQKVPVGANRPDVTKGRRQKPSPVKAARKPKGGVTGRDVSKKATALALLRRSRGATLEEMMQATGWRSHSIRGFLSDTLGKKMRLKVESGKRDNGERVYSIRH